MYHLRIRNISLCFSLSIVIVVLCKELSGLFLDYWYRYGQASRRAKVVNCAFACEGILVMFLTLNANSVFHNCPFRDPLQVICPTKNCLNCDIGAFEVSGLLKMQAAGILALHIIYQLDLIDRHNLLCNENGIVWPSNLDWNRFLGQKSGSFIIYSLQRFGINSIF